MDKKEDEKYSKLGTHTMLLIRAYKNMSHEDFMVAFKTTTAGGDHLWRQYSVTYNHNMLSFMAYLNTVELHAMLMYIADKYMN